MGFGGSVSAMISSIKANRNLVKKRDRFSKDSLRYVNSQRKPITARTDVSEADKTVLKRRLKLYKKKQQQHLIKSIAITMGVTIALAFGIYKIMMIMYFGNA